MTAGGVWLDALIVALLLTALGVLLQQISAVPVRGSASHEVATGLGRRLRSYFSSVMRQAGFDPVSGRWDYWLAKLALVGLLPLLVIEVQAMRGAGAPGLWLALPALVGFFLPDLWLFAVRRARRRRVAQGLPHFLNLMVAFLQAGLSLVESFRRAGREGFDGPHPLAREVAVVSRELDAGQDPIVAFGALAERTGVPDLHAVASALRMGLRLGAPLQETLQAQADALWTKRGEEALRRIHRAEIEIMFPVILCGFPVFAVLALFPIAIDLLEVWRELF